MCLEYFIKRLNFFFIEGLRSSRRTTCPIPKIKNGMVKFQKNGRMGHFNCASGFKIHGPMLVLCQMGRWKQNIPICISNNTIVTNAMYSTKKKCSPFIPIVSEGGCKLPQQHLNGWIMTDEKKEQANLFCHDGFLNAGSSYALCDGMQWDRELGECRQDVAYTKKCDFETTSQCGWTEESDNDFPWLRKNGWNSFEKIEYGPKHDHTVRNGFLWNFQKKNGVFPRKNVHFSLFTSFRLEDHLKVTTWLQKQQTQDQRINLALCLPCIKEPIRKKHACVSSITCMALVLDDFVLLLSQSMQISMISQIINSKIIYID